MSHRGDARPFLHGVKSHRERARLFLHGVVESPQRRAPLFTRCKMLSQAAWSFLHGVIELSQSHNGRKRRRRDKTTAVGERLWRQLLDSSLHHSRHLSSATRSLALVHRDRPSYRLLLSPLFQPLRAATLRGQPQRLSRGMRGKQFVDDLSAWLSVFDVAKLRFLVEKG